MPLMDKLREPAHECLNEVHTVMESVACALVNDSFSRFPTLVDEISSSILSVIEKVFYFPSWHCMYYAAVAAQHSASPDP